GTTLFCVAAAILHTSGFRSITLHHHLFFTLDKMEALPQAVELLNRNCSDFRQIGIAMTKEGTFRYQYDIAMKKGISRDVLLNELRLIPEIKQLRVTTNEITTSQL